MKQNAGHTDRLFSIGIEDFDTQLYEIVLPGRSHAHARHAARALLALTGPKAFRPFDFMETSDQDLKASYKRDAPALLPTLFAAYELLSSARASLKAETELFALIEYQIDQARALTRPSQQALREYFTQKALTRLPLTIVHAASVERKPANTVQANSALPKATLFAARAFSRSIERDAQEIASLKDKVRAEYIAARKSIAGLAQMRINVIRAEVHAAFEPHYKALKTLQRAAPLRPSGEVQSLAALGAHIALLSTIKAQQQLLRTRLKPVLEEKRAAMARADDLHAQFHRTDRALAASNLPDLQRQWRALASDRMRLVHGPATQAVRDPTDGGFLERIARRAGELRHQTPAPEQDRTPEPEV